ncbi:hypothetical protein U1Q18_025569, partial [Sarracenia purpurea var. burkii]
LWQGHARGCDGVQGDGLQRAAEVHSRCDNRHSQCDKRAQAMRKCAGCWCDGLRAMCGNHG